MLKNLIVSKYTSSELTGEEFDQYEKLLNLAYDTTSPTEALWSYISEVSASRTTTAIKPPVSPHDLPNEVARMMKSGIKSGAGVWLTKIISETGLHEAELNERLTKSLRDMISGEKPYYVYLPSNESGEISVSMNALVDSIRAQLDKGVDKAVPTDASDIIALKEFVVKVTNEIAGFNGLDDGYDALAIRDLATSLEDIMKEYKQKSESKVWAFRYNGVPQNYFSEVLSAEIPQGASVSDLPQLPMPSFATEHLKLPKTVVAKLYTFDIDLIEGIDDLTSLARIGLDDTYALIKDSNRRYKEVKKVFSDVKRDMNHTSRSKDFGIEYIRQIETSVVRAMVSHANNLQSLVAVYKNAIYNINTLGRLTSDIEKIIRNTPDKK